LINRTFFYPDFKRYVLFTSQALEHMYSHVQRLPRQTEAGGEVYAIDPDAQGLIITVATGPNEGDFRRRHAYNPDTEALLRDRQRQYSLGRHAVGLWHTHPEPHPIPSRQDRRTTEQYLAAYHDDRERYLMVILGNRGSIPDMVVWVANHQVSFSWTELIESSATSMVIAPI